MNAPVYLRALEDSDLERTHRWHNDRDLYEMLADPFHFASRQAESAWLAHRIEFSVQEVNLAICLKESDKHIGNIYLREINWIHRRARLDIFIGDPAERSKGYGTSAIRQVLSYAFQDLGLSRIYLHVLSENRRAIHLYGKCGFQAEGLLRKHAFKKGAWRDLVVMGIFSGEASADDRSEKS